MGERDLHVAAARAALGGAGDQEGRRDGLSDRSLRHRLIQHGHLAAQGGGTGADQRAPPRHGPGLGVPDRRVRRGPRAEGPRQQPLPDAAADLRAGASPRAHDGHSDVKLLRVGRVPAAVRHQRQRRPRRPGRVAAPLLRGEPTSLHGVRWARARELASTRGARRAPPGLRRRHTVGCSRRAGSVTSTAGSASPRSTAASCTASCRT